MRRPVKASKRLNPWNIISDMMTNLLGLVFIAGLFGILAVSTLLSGPTTNQRCDYIIDKIENKLPAVKSRTEHALSDPREKIGATLKRCEIGLFAKSLEFEYGSIAPAADYEGPVKLAKRFNVNHDDVKSIHELCTVMFDLSQDESNKDYNLSFSLRGSATDGYDDTTNCQYPIIPISHQKSTPLTQKQFKDIYLLPKNGMSAETHDQTLLAMPQAQDYMCNYTFATQRAVNIQKLCITLAAAKTDQSMSERQAIANFFMNEVSIEGRIAAKDTIQDQKDENAALSKNVTYTDGEKPADTRVDVMIRYTAIRGQ